MQEIWKDVEGFEGIYQVSNMGRVRSLDHVANSRNGVPQHHRGKILKQSADRHGYKRVHISKDGIAKSVRVHRLVAQAFCEKPNGMDIVNHLDNNPSNNCSSNLEWTDDKGNMQHAARQGRMGWRPENLRRAQEAHKIPVIAIAPDGTRIWFPSQVDAAKALKVNRGHIGQICKCRYGCKSSHGYRFEYAMGGKEH